MATTRPGQMPVNLSDLVTSMIKKGVEQLLDDRKERIGSVCCRQVMVSVAAQCVEWLLLLCACHAGTSSSSCPYSNMKEVLRR